MKWFIHAFKNIFNYRDRARGAEYGWFMLTNFLLIFTAFLTIVVASSLFNPFKELSAILTIFSFIAIIYFIAVFLVKISLTARRLHDLGWSGWWQLLIYFLHIISLPLNVIIEKIPEAKYAYSTNAQIILIAYYALWGILLLIDLILIFKDGQRFTNKYGKDPKATTENTMMINNTF